MQVLHLTAAGSPLLGNMLIEHAGVFARPEVLKEGFQADLQKPSKDAAHALRALELALLQVKKFWPFIGCARENHMRNTVDDTILKVQVCVPKESPCVIMRHCLTHLRPADMMLLPGICILGFIANSGEDCFGLI